MITQPRRALGAGHCRTTGVMLVVVIALAALSGCRSYRESPLALDTHRAQFDARLAAQEPMQAFASRLARQRAGVPEKFDPLDGISPAEGEVLALFYNADLRTARARVGVALAGYEHAGLWEDPEFGFDGAEILSPGGPFEYGLTLGVTLPVSGRLAVEKDRAGAAYEAELRRLVDAEWTVRAQVRSAWAVWTVAEERVRLLRDIAAQAAQAGSVADELEAAGELSRIEARLLRMQLIETRTESAAAEAEAARARLALLGLLGLPPDAAAELLPGIPGVEPVLSGDAVGVLIEQNTLLAVRRAEYRAAEETLRLEIRKQYPDISIGGGYGSEDNDDRLLLGLSIPVPVFNANRAGIARADALRDAARTDAETTFERLTRDLYAARVELAATREQAEAFAAELVPMLDAQSADLRRLIALGEFDSFVMLETLTRSYQAKSRLLDLRLAQHNAAVEIVRLLGPDGYAEPAPVASDEPPAVPSGARHEQATTPPDGASK